MNFRAYRTEDRSSCLAIFESNVPTFFDKTEIPDFASFLDRMPCPYFVIEDDARIAGCGGYFVEDNKVNARLIWGMVRNDLHRHGVGSYLLVQRLSQIMSEQSVQKVIINTSQHSCGFFERHGFRVMEIIPDAYAPGLHQHRMELKIEDRPRYL